MTIHKHGICGGFLFRSRARAHYNGKKILITLELSLITIKDEANVGTLWSAQDEEKILKLIQGSPMRTGS